MRWVADPHVKEAAASAAFLLPSSKVKVTIRKAEHYHRCCCRLHIKNRPGFHSVPSDMCTPATGTLNTNTREGETIGHQPAVPRKLCYAISTVKKNGPQYASHGAKTRFPLTMEPPFPGCHSSWDASPKVWARDPCKCACIQLYKKEKRKGRFGRSKHGSLVISSKSNACLVKGRFSYPQNLSPRQA